MMELIPRLSLLERVRLGLSESPVVALLGARQVGKTTLAEQLIASWNGPATLFDLEAADSREALAARPETVLRDSEGLVVIDEVQRLPEIFATLRPICDDRRGKAMFLLLGSASLDMVRGISETLAGRIQFIDAQGLSLAEIPPRRCAGAFLENAGALSRTNMERIGVGAFHGRKRKVNAPLPRPAQRRFHGARLASLVPECGKAAGEISQSVSPR